MNGNTAVSPQGGAGRGALIRTENLVHTYPKGGVTALQGVSVEICDNDKIAIVGQNGSGKTTLVRHFNGLLRPTSGKIFLYGEDTAKQKIGEMSRKVGYVFQNPNHQIFCTTVREELEVAPRNFGMSPEDAKKSIDEVVEMLNIGDVLDKHPLTLDYTTKKVVTIATVLAFRPDILIMDEPTGGLDEAGRRMLTKTIEVMHGEGHTVIMISHDMDYVAENSDRVIVMAEGRIIMDDAPGKVFRAAEVLQQAQIEPPQITQLDLHLDPGAAGATLSVPQFVAKYQA